jgi:hypothetical protein
MITQDTCRFYKSHSVYDNFGGVVLDREEGKNIAKALGGGKAVILQNHGLLTVGQSVDEAAFWFLRYVLHSWSKLPAAVGPFRYREASLLTILVVWTSPVRRSS